MERGSREAEREGARVRASVSVSDRLREREIRRPGKDGADGGAAAAAGEVIMVLVELAWLSSTFGADHMFSFVSGLGISGGTSAAAEAVLGALAARSLSLSSFFAALENDLARFLKKFDAPAIIPPPPLLLDESVLVLDVAWIWGGVAAPAGGRGAVFELGVDRGVVD